MANEDTSTKPVQSPFSKPPGNDKNPNNNVNSAQSLDISKEIKDVNKRARLIEDRFESMRKKSQLIEDNMLKSTRDINKDLSLVKDEIVNIKRKIRDINDNINLIVNELRSAPKKEDVDELKKYVDIWQPINFVTEKDLDRMLDWKLEKMYDKLINKVSNKENISKISKNKLNDIQKLKDQINNEKIEI